MEADEPLGRQKRGIPRIQHLAMGSAPADTRHGRLAELRRQIQVLRHQIRHHPVVSTERVALADRLGEPTGAAALIGEPPLLRASGQAATSTLKHQVRWLIPRNESKCATGDPIRRSFQSTAQPTSVSPSSKSTTAPIFPPPRSPIGSPKPFTSQLPPVQGGSFR